MKSLGSSGIQESREVVYAEEEIANELVVLRKLAAVHERIASMQFGIPYGEEKVAMLEHLHGQGQRILKEYRALVQGAREACGEAIGVIVGRFQVPELHQGHRYVIETVRKLHTNCVVILGGPEGGPDARNPLTFPMRQAMIVSEFPDVTVLYVQDVSSDGLWSEHLDFLIGQAFPVGKVRLYGSRDSFVPHYSGQWPTTEIAPVLGVSGTDIRAAVGAMPMNDVHFRQGVIFAAANLKKEV